MKVVLPSMGLLGCKSVNLSIPVYANLRELSLIPYNEEEIGYEFVKMLLEDPTDLDRMTFQDKDYLLIVAVSSLHLNNIALNAQCSCGNVERINFVLQDQEVLDLEEDTPKCISKECFGETYNYNFLSATEEMNVVRWAKSQVPDTVSGEEADKIYRNKYLEGFICKTFGFDINEENLVKVANYNMHVYMSALLFREMAFHGIPGVVTSTCSKCGKHLNVIVPFAKSLMNWSTQKIVDEFMQVANIVGGFKAFLDLTVSELEQMKENQNAGA